MCRVGDTPCRTGVATGQLIDHTRRMNESEDASPFHAGEREIQERLGVAAQIGQFGRRAIRDHLTGQHREFFPQLNHLLVGSIDPGARPWASLLTGRDGFVRVPDQSTLSIHSPRIYGDPLQTYLQPGAPVGVLGIQYETRRRNRVTGTVRCVSGESITIDVKQTFGNCPRYIQSREHKLLPEVDQIGETRPVKRLHRLDNAARSIIERADHFFIASYYSDEAADGERSDSTHGADVSHRGGKPGFVRIDHDGQLTFPEFIGNFYFNTLGNIVRNPKAGLLFLSFESGDLLYLTGSAEILWNDPRQQTFEGAQRFVRFTIDEGRLVSNAVPVRWRLLDYSPNLEETGAWDTAAEAPPAE